MNTTKGFTNLVVFTQYESNIIIINNKLGYKLHRSFSCTHHNHHHPGQVSLRCSIPEIHDAMQCNEIVQEAPPPPHFYSLGSGKEISTMLIHIYHTNNNNNLIFFSLCSHILNYRNNVTKMMDVETIFYQKNITLFSKLRFDV